jgi:hypothetical protein
MTFAILADGVLVVHFAFVVFVLGGALLVAWRPWIARLHLPALLWGVLVEANGWICPLTPLEQHLRRAAGEASFTGGFIERYVVALLYPEGLTPRIQSVLAVVVVVTNVALYAWCWRRRMRARAHARVMRDA